MIAFDSEPSILTTNDNHRCSQRPGLATAWEPFYSSSSSFSAHSTTSILSLQGTTPLPGHPKTLRDLTHVSEFLTLPAAFGAIQLGETFSCCFSVNNETHAAVDGVHVRLEMQTASSKSLLSELGGTGCILAAGEGLEDVVHHEVKELGQHVLGCTVTYRLPPGYPYAPGPLEGSDDPSLQSFRKFYKFSVRLCGVCVCAQDLTMMEQVTNPLSVKTKVHAPKSPSALLHPLERDKVFLEVHIQNMTQETMWFDRMELECAEGWRAVDANRLPGSSNDDTHSLQPLFSGSMALMQPQAVRQYIYILSPSSVPTFPVTHPPGAVISLGRLDISWRSKFGEPGRLLTSVSVVSTPSLVHACMDAHVPPTDALAQNSGSTTATPTDTIAAPKRYPTLPPTRTTRNPLPSIPTTLSPASSIPTQLASPGHVEIQLPVPSPCPTRNTDPQSAPYLPRALYLVACPGQATTTTCHPRARLGSGRRPRRRATCWGRGPGGKTVYARTQAERRGRDSARSTAAGSLCRTTSHASAGLRSRSERIRDRCSEQPDTFPSFVDLADPNAGAGQSRKRTSARVAASETGRRPTVITAATLFRDTRRNEECKTPWVLVPRPIRNPVRPHRPHTARRPSERPASRRSRPNVRTHLFTASHRFRLRRRTATHPHR